MEAIQGIEHSQGQAVYKLSYQNMLSFKATARSSLRSSLRSINSYRNMATEAATKKNLVEFNVYGTARSITLNRPEKLNALNTEMCTEILPRLVEYSKSDSANVILIKSNNEKSFCAGGDIVECAKLNLNNNSEKSVEFFQSEYNLNYLLSIFNKPVVSLANGIVMGGGVGLSVHNPFRVVSETTTFAMPETSIGFFNDVGTSFWLPKLDGNLGYYLSLTGERLSGFDTLLMGFGTHYVPTNRYNELIEKLSSIELPDLAINKRKFKVFNKNNSSQLYSLVNSTIEEFAVDIPKTHKFKYTNDELNTIERCFNPETHNSVNSIIEALKEDGSEFALKTINLLNEKSPLSLELNWKILLKNRDLTIKESLNRELKLASKLMVNYRNNDFNDFIQNKLIDKSKSVIKSKYYSGLENVESKVVDELISFDAYNPQKLENKSQEEVIELLNNVKINNYSSVSSFMSDFNKYPHQMGLPVESEIKNFIDGVSLNNNKFKTFENVTFKDVLDYFKLKYDNKAGVDYKVKFILNRKTRKRSNNSNEIEWIEN